MYFVKAMKGKKENITATCKDLYEKAMMAYKKSDYQKAIEFFGKVILADPGYRHVYPKSDTYEPMRWNGDPLSWLVTSFDFIYSKDKTEAAMAAVKYVEKHLKPSWKLYERLAWITKYDWQDRDSIVMSSEQKMVQYLLDKASELRPFDPKYEELRSLVQQLVKPITYIYLIPLQLQESPESFSYFGGDPYFEAGEQWPVCHWCKQQMEFVCQIDNREGFHDYPDGADLFTFFCCKNENCEHEFSIPSTEGNFRVNIYQNPAPEKAVTLVKPKNTKVAPCRIKMERGSTLPDQNDIYFATSVPMQDEEFNWAERAILEKIYKLSAALSDENEAELMPYHYLEMEIVGNHHYDTYLGGHTHWDNCMDKTPYSKERIRMQQLIQFYEGSTFQANISFYEQMSLFVNQMDLKEVRAVFDHT